MGRAVRILGDKQMLYKLLADLVLILHLFFIVFVLLGGLFILWRRFIVWLHIPVVIWALVLEFLGLICPLTPLENALRKTGGDAGYSGGFIEHYLIPLIYPSSLTRELQMILGGIVISVNIGIYVFVIYRQLNKNKKVH
jgi:hypothetical protein